MQIDGKFKYLKDKKGGDFETSLEETGASSAALYEKYR